MFQENLHPSQLFGLISRKNAVQVVNLPQFCNLGLILFTSSMCTAERVDGRLGARGKGIDGKYADFVGVKVCDGGW